MSLSFLQKKSWHTAKTSNQEVVWIKEEEKKKNEAILQEKLKEIKEEREHEEMLRITGRGDEADQAALAWMYAGGKKTEDEEKETAEDFLLGKKFEGKVEDQSDAMKTTQEGFVGGLMEQAKSVNERNEEVRIVTFWPFRTARATARGLALALSQCFFEPFHDIHS
ncbi:hypothetical protein TL16_g01388 [Triparma laevis f. inornata]|uniref:CBF1-interacting co-repressor CIR N-terminal domain-containing protein n=1 Tax=Triparma laevis f. inornata TaxID=1714386 RepID=A0A9W7DS58_9STRA|nr:hypothetical protein TL16_g01388 [Triparma laevis f. inornata]